MDMDNLRLKSVKTSGYGIVLNCFPSSLTMAISIHQVLNSATEWQRGSQICFTTFSKVKMKKIANNSATTETG